MRWHARYKSNDGLICSIVDSLQWTTVHEIDPMFKEEEQNMDMHMVVDGVNPFANQSMWYSMWPMLLAIYNLLLWLVMKKFFISLVLLIPREKAPNGDNIDIFLAPPVHDLLKLWHGVSAANCSLPIGEQNFMMRVVLL